MNDYCDMHESQAELKAEPDPDMEECLGCGVRFVRNDMTEIKGWHFCLHCAEEPEECEIEIKIKQKEVRRDG